MSGPECCSNAPILNPNSGVGHVEKLGGLDTYVMVPLTLTLPFLWFPKFLVAAAGYYVVVPDFLYGDPFTSENANRPLPIWLKDHQPNEAFEDAKPVIEALKHKGVLSIGAASFCWGAKVVVELAKSRLIQAAVLLHPSFITLDDIKGVSIPIAVLGAEIDKYCPPELLKQFEQLLTTELGDDCYVKLFPEVSHGWTIRYKIEDAMAVKAADESHQILLEWFAKHVK
ncbi:putative alpha/Beta hydrolase [Medicago truncatula]|uniref:Putative alpha/Beta hydrolase n=1 Tax=Medicago truncatula TaxID=3880 RepID=A0A396IH21_MEDTR|nr:putative alpha/Beta hydrolase [Medicago truncatula]